MSYAEEALNSMHDEAMDLLEKSGGDVLTCENERGILLIIDRNDVTAELIADITRALNLNVTLQ